MNQKNSTWWLGLSSMAVGLAAATAHSQVNSYVECICLSDPTCNAAVCPVDPFCCSVAWDQLCTSEAVSLGALPTVTQTYTIVGPGTGTTWGWEIQLTCNSTSYILNTVTGLVSSGTAIALAAQFAVDINSQLTSPDLVTATAGSSGGSGTLTITHAATQAFTLCVSTGGAQSCCLATSGTLCVFNPSIFLTPSGQDCNENNIDDAFDIFDGFSEDVNDNGVPDECERAPVFGDLDGDGFVNGADLGLLLAAWDSPDPGADLDASGTVDGADLGLLLAAWTG
jgi:hypothetical protein